MRNRFALNKPLYIIPAILIAVYTFWWIYIRQFDLDSTRDMRQLWGATYQILALYGAVVGLFISGKWGGYKSLVGRIILAFSIGLLLQVLGQSYSSYYVFHYDVESPIYPGLGDIGFFSSVLAYIYGIILLCRVSGVKDKIKKTGNKLWALIIPLLILVGSYSFFLRGHEIDWAAPVTVLLDFGYPLGQALYVSLALLALIMSSNILGGIMKRPILFLIFALVFQYFADFFFLYEASRGTWYVGNINDYLYCSSYFIMTLAIINMGNAFNKIEES